jgi:hypothetical protein
MVDGGLTGGSLASGIRDGGGGGAAAAPGDESLAAALARLGEGRDPRLLARARDWAAAAAAVSAAAALADSPGLVRASASVGDALAALQGEGAVVAAAAVDAAPAVAAAPLAAAVTAGGWGGVGAPPPPPPRVAVVVLGAEGDAVAVALVAASSSAAAAAAAGALIVSLELGDDTVVLPRAPPLSAVLRVPCGRRPSRADYLAALRALVIPALKDVRGLCCVILPRPRPFLTGL